MTSLRTKHVPKRRSVPAYIPELTAAQLNFTNKTSAKQNHEQSINAQEVLQQAEDLYDTNEVLECIKLLKGLAEYLKGKPHDPSIVALIYINLGVSYYKVGFLEQAYEEYKAAVSTMKDINLVNRINSNHTLSYRSKLPQKLKYDMMIDRIQLQLCILFSEMGKHEEALQHAKISCKLAYNMIYDLQIALCAQLSQAITRHKTMYSISSNSDIEIQVDGQQNLINNIAILHHLINSTRDLKICFLNRDKGDFLDEQMDLLRKYGQIPANIDIDMLYGNIQNEETLWIYKNKILDEILIKFTKKQKILQEGKLIEQHEVIEKIVFLAISLYCYSTQSRFLEKNKKQTSDPGEVLDSEHWLSRSLEIAYSFLPPQAPILNQILTVHDRFHGIDKQTIPEDREVGGFFKVLKPLSKPKSTYSSKSMMTSPIMIRIQVPKITINVEEKTQKSSPRKIQLANKTIDLDNLTKNNKIRGIGGGKKFEFTQYSHSTIRNKPQTKVDFTDHIKNIYANRKIKSVAEHEKSERMKINLTGVARHEEEDHLKSMRRPHSYDREITKDEHYPVQTERKKKSLSHNKKQMHKQKKFRNSESAGLKLDGLQMIPPSFKKLEEDEGFDFTEKLGSNVEATKIGGNIFINNNINLFISKDSVEKNHHRALTTRIKGDKTVYENNRRQTIVNKRKAHQSNFTGIKNPQFL